MKKGILDYSTGNANNLRETSARAHKKQIFDSNSLNGAFQEDRSIQRFVLQIDLSAKIRSYYF